MDDSLLQHITSTYALGNSVGVSSTLEMLISSEDIIVISIGVSMISLSSCEEVLEIGLSKIHQI